MTVPIINTLEQYPIPIAGRFGEWMDVQTIANHWGAEQSNHPARVALEALQKAYPEKDDRDQEFTPGDPRIHLTEEVCFVGVKDGVLGIHVEVELDCAFNDVNNQSDFEDELTREEFNDIANLYSEKLHKLASKYPKTGFFISHDDAITYKGRVCLNGFTPLIATSSEKVYTTAYQSPEEIGTFCQTIQSIADDLIDLA